MYSYYADPYYLTIYSSLDDDDDNDVVRVLRVHDDEAASSPKEAKKRLLDCLKYHPLLDLNIFFIKKKDK